MYLSEVSVLFVFGRVHIDVSVHVHTCLCVHWVMYESEVMNCYLCRKW